MTALSSAISYCGWPGYHVEQFNYLTLYNWITDINIHLILKERFTQFWRNFRHNIVEFNVELSSSLRGNHFSSKNIHIQNEFWSRIHYVWTVRRERAQSLRFHALLLSCLYLSECNLRQRRNYRHLEVKLGMHYCVAFICIYVYPRPVDFMYIHALRLYMYIFIQHLSLLFICMARRLYAIYFQCASHSSPWRIAIIYIQGAFPQGPWASSYKLNVCPQ
jgi:hypothetical protein